MEMHNLAADPFHKADLARAIAFFVAYQKTAVDDLSIGNSQHDPAANPALRPDLAWGPSVGSKLCHY
jgi:hypothetical protein